MSGGLRSMQVRHGRVVTRKRHQLVRDYLNRRANDKIVEHADTPYNWYQHNCYLDWVTSFERFMCRGLTDRALGSRRAVAHEAQDIQQPDVADAGRPDRCTAQVD